MARRRGLYSCPTQRRRSRPGPCPEPGRGDTNTGKVLNAMVNRRTIHVTCRTAGHSAAGCCNLVVTREDAEIVLNPHAANCCVIALNEASAGELRDVLTELLG